MSRLLVQDRCFKIDLCVSQQPISESKSQQWHHKQLYHPVPSTLSAGCVYFHINLRKIHYKAECQHCYFCLKWYTYNTSSPKSCNLKAVFPLNGEMLTSSKGACSILHRSGPADQLEYFSRVVGSLATIKRSSTSFLPKLHCLPQMYELRASKDQKNWTNSRLTCHVRRLWWWLKRSTFHSMHLYSSVQSSAWSCQKLLPEAFYQCFSALSPIQCFCNITWSYNKVGNATDTQFALCSSIFIYNFLPIFWAPHFGVKLIYAQFLANLQKGCTSHYLIPLYNPHRKRCVLPICKVKDVSSRLNLKMDTRTWAV